MAKACGKKVIQYDLTGTIVATYESIAEASRVLGIGATTIKSAISKNHISMKKYRFAIST